MKPIRLKQCTFGLAILACLGGAAIFRSVARAELVLNIGKMGQKFTVLPQRTGLNMADLIFVDLNHDGKDDLFVGGDASYGGDNKASFFLILGDRIRPENSPFDLSTTATVADKRYDAAAAGHFTDCTRLAKGDWNADGRQDLVIAGGGFNGIYIILGKDSITTGTHETLGPDTVDIHLAGKTGARLGREAACADMNGDGKDDLIATDGGSLYVLYGGPDFADRDGMTVDASSADITYSPWTSTLGRGDVNHDGRDDLFRGRGNTNEIFITPPAFPPHAAVDTTSASGMSTTLNFGGWSSASSFNGADINGDGTDDYVVIDDGGFKALWGGMQWNAPRTIDLATTHDLRFQYGGYYGGDQSDAADANGDAIKDLAVGEDYTGKIHVLFGRPFPAGSTVNVTSGGTDKDDLVLYNGGYHFGTWPRFGNVAGTGTLQLASGAWAEGLQYGGIVHVCFLRPDVRQVAFNPAQPMVGQNLSATYATGWDKGQQVSYRWFVNGSEITDTTGSQLLSQHFKANDQVKVEVQGQLPGLAPVETVKKDATVTIMPTPTPTPTPIPPTAPKGRLAITYKITTPSTMEGNPTIKYTYHWTSSTGDSVTHGPTTSTSDTLTEMNLVQAGETWTVTVTPSGRGVSGPTATAKVKILNAETGAAEWLFYQ